jgi:hypothetical protein
MMTLAAKIFLGLFVAFLTLTVATVGVGAAVVYSAGSVAVEVQPDDGSNLSIGLPAILIHLAIALTPDEVVEDLAHELEPFWPTVRAAAHELDRAPDFVLLEVRSAGELVLIEKRDGRLVVLVDSADEQVRVAVPLGTMRRIADKLGTDCDRG